MNGADPSADPEAGTSLGAAHSSFTSRAHRTVASRRVSALPSASSRAK